MRHIKLFEAFGKEEDIEYKQSTADKMAKSVKRIKGTSTELGTQISGLIKNFDEEKFVNLVKQLKEEAKSKFGGRSSGNYLENYIKEFMKSKSSLVGSLLKVMKKALTEMDKKNEYYSVTEQIYKIMNTPA